MDKEQQELMFKLSMSEQQINGLNQQLQAVEKAILDMQTLDIGLGDLQGKKGEEILAPIGRGIFAKAKLTSEELTVDVGGGTFVKKSIPGTQKTIKEQVGKLDEAKQELHGALEKVNEDLTKTMLEYQKKAEK